MFIIVNLGREASQADEPKKEDLHTVLLFLSEQTKYV